jgi:hypothetical protein
LALIKSAIAITALVVGGRLVLNSLKIEVNFGKTKIDIKIPIINIAPTITEGYIIAPLALLLSSYSRCS